MSTATHATSVSPALSRLLIRYHFLLRRLHSLSGLFPLGLFLFFHLFTNAQMLLGSFQHEVNFLHNLPFLFWIELLGLWLPIAFHGLLGLAYTFTGRPNSLAYPYLANWRYTLQRLTGLIAFPFLFLHIATLRWRWDILGWFTPFFAKGLTPAGQIVDLAHYSTSLALSHPLVLALYILGTLAVIYHFSNGLWTAAITWGLTITPTAQKRWGRLCLALFSLLLALTTFALWGALRYHHDASDLERSAYHHTAQLYRSGQLSSYDLERLARSP